MVTSTSNALPDVSYKRRDLSVCLGEGAAYGAMVGLGETYLPAFVLAAGLSEVTAGLVASLPLLCGGLMQLISPRAVLRLGSHKKWVLICAMTQALSFVPLVFAALANRISVPAVFVVATLYWGAGLATGPAWNTWVGTLVPFSIRARFFARRTYLTQITVLAGLLTGGIVLHVSEEHGMKFAAFAGLFTAAAVFRTMSTLFLANQSEPIPLAHSMRRTSIPKLLKKLRGTSGGRLLLFLVTLQAGVQISGPFYAPYMLETLRFSYAQYVALVAIAFVSKIIALPHLGHLAHRIGAMKLLRWSGWGIVPLAAVWIISGDFYWLLTVQFAAGVIWGTYELAFFLLFFESFPEDERTSILTLYNVANTSALVGGSAIGGTILYLMGPSQKTFLLLFGISSIARGLALLLLEQMERIEVVAEAIGVRTIGVRPMAASIDNPVLPSLPDQLGQFPDSLKTEAIANSH